MREQRTSSAMPPMSGEHGLSPAERSLRAPTSVGGEKRLFYTLKEAGLAQIQADLARGIYTDPAAGKVTVRTYAKSWLAAQTFDPSTREATELRLRLHIFPELGGRHTYASVLLEDGVSIKALAAPGWRSIGPSPQEDRSKKVRMSARADGNPWESRTVAGRRELGATS